MKIIVYYADRWCRELLTISRYETVEYFVDDDIGSEEGVFFSSSIFKDGDGKKIYKVKKLAEENPSDVVIIISNSRRYAEARDRLESLGLIEGVHFFNGWKLSRGFYRRLFGEVTEWKDYEINVNPTIQKDNSVPWSQRTKIMSTIIPMDVQAVMDIGCGEGEKLRDYLHDGVEYYGVDIIKRSEKTIVCDINKEKLPKISCDCFFLAGVVQYVNSLSNLVSQMKDAKYIVFSYEDDLNLLRLDSTPSIPLIAICLNNKNSWTTIADVINCLSSNGFVIDEAICNYMSANSYIFRARNIRDL